MSVPEILRSLGETFQSGATVKNVYGDPITHGDRTVIPVARVSYAFGGGGGAGNRGGEQGPRGTGGGGGGNMSAIPAGLIEITPEGTRFMPIPDWRKLVAIAAISLVIGFVIGHQRANS